MGDSPATTVPVAAPSGTDVMGSGAASAASRRWVTTSVPSPVQTGPSTTTTSQTAATAALGNLGTEDHTSAVTMSAIIAGTTGIILSLTGATVYLLRRRARALRTSHGDAASSGGGGGGGGFDAMQSTLSLPTVSGLRKSRGVGGHTASEEQLTRFNHGDGDEAAAAGDATTRPGVTNWAQARRTVTSLLGHHQRAAATTAGDEAYAAAPAYQPMAAPVTETIPALGLDTSGLLSGLQPPPFQQPQQQQPSSQGTASSRAVAPRAFVQRAAATGRMSTRPTTADMTGRASPRTPGRTPDDVDAIRQSSATARTRESGVTVDTMMFDMVRQSNASAASASSSSTQSTPPPPALPIKRNTTGSS